MSVQPRTPNGVRVSDFLQTILAGREDFSFASIQRVFFSYSEIVVNEDAFVDRLFEQDVLPKTAENLKESHRTRESRYKYGVEIACKKKKMREVVVAFEKSGNEHVIEELLKRIERQSSSSSVATDLVRHLQLNIRMLTYGANTESSSVVTSSPPPSANVTCLSEEPIPHEVCAIALESVEDAAILERHAIVSLEMGKCAEAKEQLEKVLKFKESYYGCVGSHLASTINSLAEAHFGLGDFLTARRLCVKALETEPDDFTSADVICNLGLAYIAVGRFEEAKVELEEACDRVNRKSALSDCGLLIKAKVLSVLGITYSYIDDVEKAKQAVSSCLALIRSYEVSPKTEAKVVDIKCCLGYALVRTESDDQEKGLEFLESAVVYFESTHSSDHYKYLDALHLLGFSYGLRLGWKRGLEILERCTELSKLYYGDDNIITGNFFQSLAIAFSALNDNKKAAEVFEKSLKILEQFRHPFYEMARLHSFQFLSQCYVKLQNYEKAKEVLKTSLEIEQKQKSSGRKPTKSTLTLLAKVYLLIGYQRHDIEFLENNLEKEKRLRHRIEFIDDLVISYILLGRAYGAFGDKARETEMNKEALDMEKRRREGLLGNGN